MIMAQGEAFAYGNMRTGSDSPESARNSLNFALGKTDLPESRIDYCIGTGYGRGRVNMPMVDRSITEIACHSRGANFVYGPQVRTVLDVGGQDIKAIQCDDKGKVTNFLMKDKCAAGTGRGMEVFADLLGVRITEVRKWKEIGVRSEFAITGSMAKNKGMIQARLVDAPDRL
jgi:benzoyl-CoA reductase subunit A